jgi:rare lipoprotein A
MRTVWVAALFALLTNVGTTLPASAAGAGETVRQKSVRAQSERGDGDRYERRRVARATIGDSDDAYETRSRPRYEEADEDRPRYTRRRHARHVTRGRHRHRLVSRSNRRTAHRAHKVRHASRPDGVAARPTGGELHGTASYYYQGRLVASGARFNPDGMTAAHRTLPFGTRVRVTHLGNGRSVNVTINDRGPFIGGRIIDLSRGAAGVIGMMGQGLARVSVQILGR